MVVPMPFSRALFLYGTAITVPRDGDTEEWRLCLEASMRKLADDAERLVNE